MTTKKKLSMTPGAVKARQRRKREKAEAVEALRVSKGLPPKPARKRGKRGVPKGGPVAVAAPVPSGEPADVPLSGPENGTDAAPQEGAMSASSGVPETIANVLEIQGNLEHSEPASVSAEAPAAAPSEGPGGALVSALGGSVMSGTVSVAGAGLMAANYGLVLGLANYLLGPGIGLFGMTLGQSAATGVVCTELVCGHVLTERLHEGRRDMLTWLVMSCILVICLSEVVGSYVRETMATQAARVSAVKDAANLAAQAHHETAPIQSRPQEQMPEGLTKREQLNWRRDQRAKDKEFMDKQLELAAQAEERQAKTQKEQERTLGDAQAAHSVFEVPVLMMWALAMSLGAVIAAGAFGNFVRSVLAVPVAVAALFRRSAPAVVAQEAVKPLGGIAVKGGGVIAALVPSPSVWQRLARFPLAVRRMFQGTNRQPEIAGGAA